MHSRILYGYLILTTGAHLAEFYVERQIAMSIFVTLVALRWVVVPMLCNCARRTGTKESLAIGEQILAEEQARRIAQRSQSYPT